MLHSHQLHRGADVREPRLKRLPDASHLITGVSFRRLNEVLQRFAAPTYLIAQLLERALQFALLAKVARVSGHQRLNPGQRFAHVRVHLLHHVLHGRDLHVPLIPEVTQHLRRVVLQVGQLRVQVRQLGANVACSVRLSDCVGVTVDLLA